MTGEPQRSEPINREVENLKQQSLGTFISNRRRKGRQTQHIMKYKNVRTFSVLLLLLQV
jgi:hypothetical protein